MCVEKSWHFGTFRPQFWFRICVSTCQKCDGHLSRDWRDHAPPNDSERVGCLSDSFAWSKKFVSKNLDILVLSGRNFDFKFNLNSENETTTNCYTSDVFGISTSSSELFVLNRFRMVCNKPQTTAIDPRTSRDTYERCLWYTLIRDPDSFEEDLVSFWQNEDFDCHTHFWVLLGAKGSISSVFKPFQSLFLVVAANMSQITVIWNLHHGQLAGAYH